MTVGADEVVDDEVVEKFPAIVPVLVDVAVMEPVIYVTVVLVMTSVVTLSVAVSRPVPDRIVVDARVMVVESVEDVGGTSSDDVWVPVRTTIPSVEEDDDSVVVVSEVSSLAAWARVPRLRSNRPHSLKGAIVQIERPSRCTLKRGACLL